MLDDLFDWYDDLERKGCTYLLSEAVRRKSGNESVEAWMMREGFSWGVQCLRDQMLEVRRLAHKLRCPALVEYLDAVMDRTRTFLEHLSPDDLDRVVDRRWDPPVTLGVRLVSIADDSLQHAGQAAYLRGLLGV